MLWRKNKKVRKMKKRQFQINIVVLNLLLKNLKAIILKVTFYKVRIVKKIYKLVLRAREIEANNIR